MNLENLSPEQIEKAKACKTPEELFELAKAEGVELSDDQLEAVSAGGIWDWDCPADLFAPHQKPKRPNIMK